MRLAGTAYGKIAATLNLENIPSPRIHWYQLVGQSTDGISQLWTDSMVKIILHNEIYAGNLRMNYTGTRSYKDHTSIRKSKSEWIWHVGTHEAIISANTWETVQEINTAAKRRSDGSEPPTIKLFSGKLVCADCKSKLAATTETQRRKNGTSKKYVFYCCWQYTRSVRTVCS